MKKIAALCLIAAVLFVLSCQESAATKAEREQMGAQIKTLETQVTEMGAKLEMLTTDFTNHMNNYHPKKVTTPTKPAGQVKPPTRK